MGGSEAAAFVWGIRFTLVAAAVFCACFNRGLVPRSAEPEKLFGHMRQKGSRSQKR